MDGGGPGVAAAHCSRGCAFGDFDNDGDIDILIVNLNEPPSLLRNDIRGEQSLAEGQADGSEVEPQRDRRSGDSYVTAARSQAQEVLSQSSFYSSNDPRLHFGLGTFGKVDIEVFWPNGLHERHNQIAANQLVTLKEGAGKVPSAGWTKS